MEEEESQRKLQQKPKTWKYMSTSAVAEAVEVVDLLLGLRGRLPRQWWRCDSPGGLTMLDMPDRHESSSNFGL